MQYDIDATAKSVSRNHLEIHIDDGNISIYDCSSRGTVLREGQNLLSHWSGEWGNHTIYAGLVKEGDSLQSTKIQLCIEFQAKENGVLVSITKVSEIDAPQIVSERPAKKRKIEGKSKWRERAVSGTVGALVGTGLTVFGLAQVGASLKR